MTIPAIDFIPNGMSLEQLAYSAPQNVSRSFGDWLQAQMSGLNTALANNDAMVTRLAAGQTENLHQIVIGMEEAKVAFQLAIQVRNRVLEAYQDVLRMQV